MVHLKGKFEEVLIKSLFTKMCTAVRKPTREGEAALACIESLLPLSEEARKHVATAKNSS